MGKITVELIRRKAEHNEGEIHSLEEIALHQEKLEKIELLDKVCKNLRILLLQNNSISKIENVSRLKNLEYLNLALNLVERVENLEGCEALTKLDLTLNFVGEISSLRNLQGNYRLEQLYMTGNPCHDFPGYREYVITILPQLKELDGIDISKSERILARQNFGQVSSSVFLSEKAYLDERHAASNTKVGCGEILRAASRPDTVKTTTDAEADDEAENEQFWSQITSNTPETRREMNRRIEKKEQAKAKSDKKRDSIIGKKEKMKARKLETEDGRILNMNEPKISFALHDEVERNQLVLDLAVPKFLCTTLIDADVQPTYVRILVKGKVFQLVLPEEVKPDSSYAQRSQTTGHLIITMPKLHESSTLIWRGGSGQMISLTSKSKSNLQKKSGGLGLKKTASENETSAISLSPKVGKPPKIPPKPKTSSSIERGSSLLPSPRIPSKSKTAPGPALPKTNVASVPFIVGAEAGRFNKPRGQSQSLIRCSSERNSLATRTRTAGSLSPRIIKGTASTSTSMDKERSCPPRLTRQENEAGGVARRRRSLSFDFKNMRRVQLDADAEDDVPPLI